MFRPEPALLNVQLVCSTYVSLRSRVLLQVYLHHPPLCVMWLYCN